MSHTQTESKSLLALAITGLVCWGFALYLPLSQVSKFGLINLGRLISVGESFRNNGQHILALVTDLTIVVFPTLLFLLLPIIVISQNRTSPVPGARFAFSICAAGKEWAMPEVLMLSALVAFIKLGDLATAEFDTGFYFLLASSLILIYLLRAVRLPKPRLRGSRNAAWALLISATILLVPANVLPIMEVRSVSGTSRSTIIGGVADLSGHGLWGIASIVFIASILVPFGKIGSVAWLLFSEKNSATLERQNRIHRALHVIGRWSMLDIFLIGILAGLVDFGAIATIQAGPAAPAFAASVVLTILALNKVDHPNFQLQTQPTP
ncbi:paraquat-inducible protein A [Pelagicoccus albus]|uniref:Paraquat-inducible protein A n=1 Tax=Pelagicoccus albus TaxID=415222 RepID=A0A7X1B6G8_9BACT|nr:paraquat-inducible protein A [Pelagicoccus albus]MBC2606541.1 paraquat-inducible protein A [Pelagicoccus albus]